MNLEKTVKNIIRVKTARTEKYSLHKDPINKNPINKNEAGLRKRINKLGIRCLAGILMIGCLMSAAGCKKQTETGEGVSGEAGNTKAMGRYVETAFDISGTMPNAVSLEIPESGGLEIFDYENGRFRSDHAGESWQNTTPGLAEELLRDYYFMGIASSPDGDVALQLFSSNENETAESKYLLIRPDGSSTELSFSLEENQSIETFWFTADSSMYAASSDGIIFSVDKESGKNQIFEQVSGRISFIESTEDYLVILTNSEVFVFDKETKEKLQDTALNQFVAQKPGVDSNIRYSRGGTYPIYLLHDKENMIYLFSASGVYRHLVGGELIEQLVNGSLSSLSDPSMGIAGAVKPDEDTFYVLYSGGMLVRFTYNAEIAAIPEIQLCIYSLEKQEIISQAVALFRTRYPEVYVRYEVGMDASGTVTREDAIKKLNTEIAAGEGPDLFVLDDLPVESYIDKGILRDLSSFRSSLPEEERQLDQMSGFWEREGAVYVLPAQFSVPLLFGPKEKLDTITDLASLADQAELWRDENVEGLYLGSFTPEDLLEKLTPFCQPAWRDESGKVKKEELEYFYAQSLRIWNAESAGISETEAAKYESKLEQYISYGYGEKEARKLAASLSDQAMEYAAGRQQLLCGTLSDLMDFSIATSSFRLQEGQESSFSSELGQAKNCYGPYRSLGISTATDNIEMAEELLGTILSEKNLSMIFGIFPNHQKALMQAYQGTAVTDAGQGGVYGVFTVEKEDGTDLEMEIYWPEEVLFDRLDQIIRKAETPYIHDAVLEETVTSEGVKVLAGEMSPQDAAASVEQKLSIYLAE